MPRNANQSKSSNYSMEFDGTNQTIATSYYWPTGNTAKSISLWFYKNSGSSEATLIGGGQNSPGKYFGLSSFTSGNRFKFDINPSIEFSANSAAFDQWQHIVVTAEPSGSDTILNGYVDGVLDSEFPKTITGGINTSSAAPVTIGENNLLNYNKFPNGKIDAVAIFDYALSSSQITTLYGNSTNGLGNPIALPRTPVAYYPLGTSAWDGNFLAENNAIGDYVFKTLNTTQSFTSNINQSNTGNKFTVSLWAKNNGVYRFWFDHGATNEGGFQNIGSQLIVYLANNFYQYFTLPSPDLTTDGNWHHYVIYVDSNDVTNSEIWIDKNSLTKASSVSSGSALAFTSGFKLTPRLAEVSNMMYFINYEIDQANVDKLYNYGSPLMSTATLTQAPNAWYKLDASEIYNSSSTEWSVDNNAYPSAYLSSLNFDGTSDYISCGNDSSLVPSSITISLWFKTSGSASAIPRLLNKSYGGSPYDSYFIRINNGVLNFKIGVSSASVQIAGTTNVVDGIWHHVVGTYDGSQLKLYLDGNPEATPINETRAILENTTYNLTIGCELGAYGFSWPFTGDISNVAIYNTALSATNVSTLYNNGAPQATIYGSPVSHWKLDNTTTGIEDSAGSNNGTNNGATEYAGFVNTLAGDSSGMSQSNLVQSDLQTVAPYSKYAMSFDGIDDKMQSSGMNYFNGLSSISFSVWINPDATQDLQSQIFNSGGGNFDFSFGRYSGDSWNFSIRTSSTAIHFLLYTLPNWDDGKWKCMVGTYDSVKAKIYVDGNLLATSTDTDTGNVYLNSSTLSIGQYGANYYNGKMSNLALWDTELTTTQVREIYNEGLPSNLNSHSAYSNLISWWQLGENSSYVSGWTCVDEKGSNNATSTAMAETALTNGVGTTANGTSSGMAVGALVGNAPYSTANAISSGMAVTAKGTDVPS